MTEEREIQQVLARYVRGTDARDGAAVAELFIPDGKVALLYHNGGELELIVELVGRQAIANAVAQMMRPHLHRAWSHHTTHDHIIEVDGDEANLDAQFIVFHVQGKQRPSEGWPDGTSGVQGTVTPVESGYYRPHLRRVDGNWKIEVLRIVMTLPLGFPNK